MFQLGKALILGVGALIRGVVIQLIRAGTLCCHFCCAVAFLDLFLDFLSAGISSQAPGSPPIPIPTPKSQITTNKQPQHHFWDTSPDPNGIFPQTWVDFPSVSLLCFTFPFVFFNPHKISIKLCIFLRIGSPTSVYFWRAVGGVLCCSRGDLGFAIPQGRSPGGSMETWNVKWGFLEYLGLARKG